MKNLLASWFRSLTAFDSTPAKQEFSIADPTSADPKGLNTVTLSVSPSDGQSPTIVSLYFEGSGVKLFEKQYQDDQSAQTEVSAMAKDLNEAATLSKEGKLDEAKNLVSSLIEKYKRHSDTLVQPSPITTNTQATLEPKQYKGFNLEKLEDGRWMASQDELAFMADSIDAVRNKVDNMLRKAHGKKLAKRAEITMQNIFFDTPDEALEYQEKMKKLQGPEAGEGKPLWEQMGNEEVAPSNETAPEEDTELAPPSLSFDRIEKDKAKTDKDIGKRIKEQVKTEVESALEQKSASVFGPDQEELVEALRKNGRNWDEIKKIFIKELSYNEDDTTVFLDSIRQKEEGGSEGLPLPPKPPEDLVSPETHDKLVKEIEDKTEIKPEPKPLENEIARADNTEIRKVADYGDKRDHKKIEIFVDGTYKATTTWAATCAEAKEKYLAEHKDLKPEQVKCQFKTASLNIEALNPLQEPPAIGQTPSQPLAAPVQEAPTFDSPVPPSQDSNPEPEFLEAPQAGDRVYVMGDYETGEDGYEGTMVSDYTSKGDEYAVISKDNGENAEVALHRVVKASQKKVAKAYYEKKAQDSKCPDCGGVIIEHEEENHTCPTKECRHGISNCDICPKEADLNKKAEPYQGYANFSTWGLSLWLDNERPLYDLSRALAQEIKDPNVLAKNLQSNFNGLLEEKGGEGKSSAEVDWLEIANDLLAEAKENETYEKSQSAETAIESLPTMDVEKEKDTLLDQLAKETDPEKKKSLEQKYKRLSMASVDPELQSLHESVLKIKAELERDGEIAIYFHKKGIEKKASDDSAFEGNGWCRVWIQDDEISSDKRYPEILKLQDETARIDALKDLARELAHEALRLADSAGAKVGVQAWFESLNPSDHDNIDWIALANPQAESVESSQEPTIEKQAWTSAKPFEVQSESARSQMHFATKSEANAYAKELRSNGHDAKVIDHQDIEPDASLKQAADPVPAPEVPVTYKELERAPKHTDRSKALPATQEQAEVTKNLQISMASIESIKDLVKRVKADLDKRIQAIQQAGGLSQLEEGKKKQVDQLAALINATENKLISYGEHLYGYAEQTEKIGPKLTDAWRVEKLVEKFAGAAEYLKAAEAGAQNMAKEVTTKTLTKFPKLSRLDKQAGFLDSLSDVYSNVMEALKLIIGSEQEQPMAV